MLAFLLVLQHFAGIFDLNMCELVAENFWIIFKSGCVLIYLLQNLEYFFWIKKL